MRDDARGKEEVDSGMQDCSPPYCKNGSVGSHKGNIQWSLDAILVEVEHVGSIKMDSELV